MQDKIQNKLSTIKESTFMSKTAVLCKTFWSVALVIGPAVLSAYLLIIVADKVVTVLGVLSGVVSIVNLVRVSYRANATPKKAIKKASK